MHNVVQWLSRTFSSCKKETLYLMISRKLEIPRELHAKKGTIKDRNGMVLTEAEDIKKR